MTNVNQKEVVAKKLADLPTTQLIEDARVKNKFVQLFQTMHGSKHGEIFYEAEKFHFLKIINENKSVGECSKMSLYGCFMDVAVSGLSFDPTMKHLYLVPFNTNIGTKQTPKWEKRCSLMISPYGELHLRKKCGQIKYVDNPVVVYKGDAFKIKLADGKTMIEYESVLPRESDEIIGCFIRITRPDDTVDFKVLDMGEIQKLRNYSKDPNGKAWTDGLRGMIEAKTIKHAFRSYPKIRMGDFSQLSSETVDTEIVDEAIDYSIDETPAQEQSFEPETPAKIEEKKAPIVHEDDAF